MDYETLIKVSFALVALQLSDTFSAEADEILMGPGAKELARDMPALKDALRAYSKGAEFDLTEYGNALKEVVKGAQRDPSITASGIDVIKTLGLWFRVESEAAYRKLTKFSGQLRMPWLAALFIKEVGSQTSYARSLHKLVQRATGRNDTALTLDEAKELKDAGPNVYKEYLRLRREYNQVWKDALTTFVRQSGKNNVPIADALRYLQKNGIEHTLPSGFTGNIGPNGLWYTKDGRQIDGVPSSAMFPSVKMNPDNEGDWVFVALRADGSRGNYFYTTDFKTARRQKKFKVAHALIKNIDKLKRKWWQKVKDFDVTDPTCVAALVIDFLYVFSGRIGGVGNAADGKSTYGMSTILLKHCTLMAGNRIRIRYPGKDGVKFEHWLEPTSNENKLRIRALKYLLEDDVKGPKDYVFTVVLKGGKRSRVSDSFIRQYWKQIGAGEANIHKLRTIMATQMMQEALEQLYASKGSYRDPRRFLADLTKMAVGVGRKLNHVRRSKEGTQTVTPTTALQNYIDPDMLVEAFNHYKVPVPRWLEKLVAKG